jgi:hypothetical protein
MALLHSRPFLCLLGLAVFLLNPSACDSGDGGGFQYGASEMRAVVEGTWQIDLAPMAGAPTTLEVQLTQGHGTLQAAARSRATGGDRRLVRAAAACGTRTLVRSAAACLDVTEMPLAVLVLEGDEALRSAPANGTFSVIGLTFVSGQLSLTIGPYVLSGDISSGGEVMSLRVPVGGGTATMRRLAP